jgi:hypothetical protein
MGFLGCKLWNTGVHKIMGVFYFKLRGIVKLNPSKDKIIAVTKSSVNALFEIATFQF